MEKNIDYKMLADKYNKKSPILKRTLLSFLGGGALCLIGELISYIYIYMGVNESDSYLLVTLTFIFIGASLTALGVFDKISGFIYSGALVPVTGFSNSVTSAAMDACPDGCTSGVGVKIFTVAGPVVLFATVGGFLYGLVYYLTTLVMNLI